MQWYDRWQPTFSDSGHLIKDSLCFLFFIFIVVVSALLCSNASHAINTIAKIKTSFNRQQMFFLQFYFVQRHTHFYFSSIRFWNVLKRCTQPHITHIALNKFILYWIAFAWLFGSYLLKILGSENIICFSFAFVSSEALIAMNINTEIRWRGKMVL